MYLARYIHIISYIVKNGNIIFKTENNKIEDSRDDLPSIKE